ncbi:MAG: hypothetical protein H7296_04235 [Bacteroidia bacterium]|nr:hypothetical protein [Bacteroidia bacterium]
MKYFKLSILLFVLLLMLTCKKNKNTVNANTDFFGPVPVDFYINMDLPSAVDLKFPNGYFYQLNAGFKGVVVYNTGFSGPDQYVAYDRTCPYRPDSSCSYVSIDSSSTLFFRCGQYLTPGKFTGCCASKFTAINGTQVEGKATRGLRQYYVTNYGNQLRITNTPL